MFWLKSCPHCRGDLYEDEDLYGRYVACLQCGHHLGESEKPFLRSLPQWGAEARPGQGAGDGPLTARMPDDARVLQAAA